MNNNSNNCGGCGTTCSECGRPWAICKQDGGCGCNKCKDIKFCEYGRMANGCIREKQPGCPMQAVIPSVTVESIEGIKNLADCLVHVSDINTTFYIDDKHRPIITWAGPIDIPGYDMEGNPNNYRDQIVTDVANQIAVIYDRSGNGYTFGLAENLDVQEEINNKLDEMAESGELGEIIDEYFNGTLQYIFPKKWNTTSQGETSLLKYRDKLILIDCANVGTNTNLAEMITNAGGGKLYAFIISHYDLDHAGSWQYVLENYCDENTKIYLPADVQTYGADIITTRNNIINYCTAHDLTAHSPLEGEVLEVDSMLKLTFLNCDVATLDAEEVKSYNNCSLCVWINHKNTTSFFTGDIGNLAMTRMFNLGYPIANVTLFKVPHHGSDLQCNERFIYQLSPEYAVQQTPTATSNNGSTSLCRMTALLRDCGTKTYITNKQPNYNIFISNGDSINCLSGVVGSESSGVPSLTYYVDSNASVSAIQNGTSSHPFGGLQQALASIPRDGIKDVTINVADGSYCYGDGVYDIFSCQVNVNKNIKVIINGNSADNSAVVINGIRADRSYLILQHLTIDIDNRDGIEAFNSYVQLNDVVIAPASDTLKSGRKSLNLRGNTYCTNTGKVTLENAGTGIYLNNATFVSHAEVHLDNITQPIDRAGDEFYSGLHFTFETASDGYYFPYKISPRSPISILDNHEEYATSLTTKVSMSDLSWVEIFFKSKHNRYGSTGKIYSPQNKYINLLESFTSSTPVTLSEARVKLSNKTISIESQREVEITSGGNTITTTTDSFDIVKVIGSIGNDYVEL